MLLGNITVVMVITMDAKLHQPMYVMICNLAVCDILGGTSGLTPMMSHFLTGDKTIGYVAAIVLGFCVHTHVSAIPTILAAMAYDRYVAICQPLQYHTIMTTGRLVSLCFLAWFSVVFLVTIRFILNVRTPLYGTLIKHILCSDQSIMRLACVPTPINTIYDLFEKSIVKLWTFSVIAFSYAMILKACTIKQEKNSRSKAIQTCSSHLIIYITSEIAVLIIIMSFRLQGISPNIKKFFALFLILPPTMSPIIYGIAMKDIRTPIVTFFKSPVLPKVAKRASTTQSPK